MRIDEDPPDEETVPSMLGNEDYCRLLSPVVYEPMTAAELSRAGPPPVRRYTGDSTGSERVTW